MFDIVYVEFYSVIMDDSDSCQNMGSLSCTSCISLQEVTIDRKFQFVISISSNNSMHNCLHRV